MSQIVAAAAPTDRTDYWNGFYRDRPAGLAVPSQFGVFVLGETPDKGLTFDLGCGTGRDALYFASRGRDVIGVDGSEAVVDLCTATAVEHELGHAGFIASRIDAPDLFDRLERERGDRPLDPSTVVYARFFLHAITEAEEAALLGLAARLCSGGGTLAVEFRTTRDAEQAKVTGPHFRRFISPVSLVERAAAHGFACCYFVEGFGYAKFKDDDAHVARLIFRRSAD